MKREPRLHLDDDMLDLGYVDDSDTVDGFDNIDTDIPSEFSQRLNTRLSQLNTHLANRRKGKKRKHRKAKRIIGVIGIVLILSVLGVSFWNAYQLNEVERIVGTIDDTYTMQETGISNAKKLGNLFTIHDSKSFNWVMSNIQMTPSLKSTLFTANENGEYVFTGSAIASDNAPTYSVVEVQYGKSTSPLSYLIVFNVTLSNGTVRTYYVTCEFEGDVLTSFHAY